MNSIIVIGDVHGCFETLMALISKLPKDVPFCMVGDLVDRGPENRRVINYVRENNIPCVIGNHEVLMESTSKEINQCWLMNGGYQTVKEYGDDDRAFVNDREWISSLPLYLEFKDVKNSDGRHLVVSHTTLADHWQERDEESAKYRATWDRKHYPKDIPGVFNVYGHTPVKAPVIKDYFANIDTGCVYDGSHNLGRLTALQYPEMNIYEQKCIDFLDMTEALI